MSEIPQNPEKSISERISELMASLDKDQIRFAIACMDHKSKKDAALAIDLKPDTVYRWNGEVDELIGLIARDHLGFAMAMRKHALAKAWGVKIAGLDSFDEKIRQSVASEIIEWEMGKATQHTDITSGGMPLVMVNWDDSANDPD